MTIIISAECYPFVYNICDWFRYPLYKHLVAKGKAHQNDFLSCETINFCGLILDYVVKILKKRWQNRLFMWPLVQTKLKVIWMQSIWARSEKILRFRKRKPTTINWAFLLCHVHNNKRQWCWRQWDIFVRKVNMRTHVNDLIQKATFDAFCSSERFHSS